MTERRHNPVPCWRATGRSEDGSVHTAQYVTATEEGAVHQLCRSASTQVEQKHSLLPELYRHTDRSRSCLPTFQSLILVDAPSAMF